MTKVALVLGSTGRFGRNAATAFEKAGWEVRRFDRASQVLLDEAGGADVILNGWNTSPETWAKSVPNVTAQIIEVAKASGATVIIPGNVYSFGSDMPETLDAQTAHKPDTSFGVIRAEMEASYRTSGVRTIVLRAGDFIDTQASGNWFDSIIMPKAKAGKVGYPGPTDVPHAWAYLPDMAQAAVLLAERRDDLATFEDVPFAGITLTGNELAAAAAEVLRRPMTLKGVQWWAIKLSQPFWPLGRYLVAMRYLWQRPHRLSGDKLARLCPDFVPTPLHDALRSALEVDVHPDEAMRASRIDRSPQED